MAIDQGYKVIESLNLDRVILLLINSSYIKVSTCNFRFKRPEVNFKAVARGAQLISLNIYTIKSR